jgi:hypothetical protein
VRIRFENIRYIPQEQGGPVIPPDTSPLTTRGLRWRYSNPHPHESSQSHITTDSQSASPSWCQAPIWDPRSIFLLLPLIIVRQLRGCWCVVPSLTRSRFCSFQFLPGITLVGHKSKLSTNNKLFICKTIVKPIWTCRIQLWGTASTSNIEILERFQSKALRMIVDAPWYVLNTVIRRDLQIPTVKEEIRCYSSQYSARLSAHLNGLMVNLIELPDNKTPVKWSAYRIPSVIVVFVVLVCKV